MSAPCLLVPVSELEREDEVSREWELSPSWLTWAFEGTDATTTGTPGHFSATLSRNGREVLVRGSISAQVTLPCARTLDPAVYDLSPALVLILHKKEDPTLGRRASRPGARRAAKEAKEAKEAGSLSNEDAAEDSFSGEHVVLDEFVREQLLLELPMFPLRSDLRFADAPGIPAPPQEPNGSSIDPRLLPLKALADKLKTSK
jgi:uncharacterized protein